MSPIAPTNTFTPPVVPTVLDRGAAGKPGDAAATTFGDLMRSLLEEASELNETSEANIAGHLTGGPVTLDETVIGVRKFDLVMRAMVQIRNKLVQAFNEIQQLRM